MRSAEGSETKADCEDPMIKAACLIDDDSCPAECKASDEKEDTDTVVKAGDLDVATSGDSNGKLFIGRDSDLDTITFKTSEEVSISKITLERIGYSTSANIESVKLEDSKGATIADAKPIDSKGQVKLTLKKDYKAVDGEFDAVVVVKTYSACQTDDTDDECATVEGAKLLQAGGTIGFKVVNVESTAKNTNISSKANTYTAIAYDGSKIEFSNLRPTYTKEYNFEAGELYEVAKFRVKAPDDSSILLRGFTFDKGAGNLDLRKYFDKAEVTIAGEKVSGLDASVNKSDELVVTFKDYEIASKQKAEVIVKIALVEDFDQFTDATNKVQLSLKDFVAVDGKVESRVSAINDYDALDNYYGLLAQYTFKGSKIKLSTTKLGNVDAALESENILVAEGNVTVAEAVKGTFTITASGNGAGAIKQMTVSINGDETDANPKDNGDDTYSFTFKNVEIEKSGKVQFLIDTKDATDDNMEAYNKETIKFQIFNVERFANAKDIVYDESGKSAIEEVSGSISFSNVTIQPAKASMNNTKTKDSEFLDQDSKQEIVLEGTYTAKNGDIKLREFLVTNIESTTLDSEDLSELVNGQAAPDKVRFYLFINDKEVADAKLVCGENACTAGDTFNDVLVENGKSVSIRVEAEVEANNGDDNLPVNLGKYQVKVRGEDVNGNKAGEGKANTATLKVVGKGSVKVTDVSKTKETIVRKANDAVLARFNIKPANGASSVTLEQIKFNITGLNPDNDEDLITVKVDGIDEDSYKVTGSTIDYTMNRQVKEEGVEVVITVDNEDDQTNIITLDKLIVNGKSQSKTFTKRFVPAAVEIVEQKVSNGSTVFKLKVDANSDTDVALFSIYGYRDDETIADEALLKTLNKVFDNGDTISVSNIKDHTFTLSYASYLYSEESIGEDAACYDYEGNTTGDDNSTDCKTNGGVWADDDTVWTIVEIDSTSLPDYFKIDDADLKVMNL